MMFALRLLTVLSLIMLAVATASADDSFSQRQIRFSCTQSCTKAGHAQDKCDAGCDPFVRCQDELMQLNYDSAASACTSALEYDFGPELRAGALNLRGTAFVARGELDRGIHDLNESIALKPDFAAAYNNRGWGYYMKGEYIEAVTDYNRAIQLDPMGGDAYNNRGYAHLVARFYTSAKADFDKALSFPSHHANAAFGRAEALFAKGQFAEAAEQISELIETGNADSDRAEAILWWLAASRRSGRHDPAAEATAREALDFDTWPGPLAGYLIGARSEDDVEANAATAVAFNTTASSPKCQAAFFLAQGDLAEGHDDAARARLEHAVDICPLNSNEWTMARAQLMGPVD